MCITVQNDMEISNIYIYLTFVMYRYAFIHGFIHEYYVTYNITDIHLLTVLLCTSYRHISFTNNNIDSL